MLGDAKGYELKQEYTPDLDQLGREFIVWMNYIVQSEGSHEKLHSNLKKTNYTHIFLNKGNRKHVLALANYLQSKGEITPENKIDVGLALNVLIDLENFLKEYSETIYANNEIFIYALK